MLLRYNAAVPYWGPSEPKEESATPRTVAETLVDVLFATLGFVNAPIVLGYTLAPNLSGGIGVLAAWWLIGFAMLPLITLALMAALAIASKATRRPSRGAK